MFTIFGPSRSGTPHTTRYATEILDKQTYDEDVWIGSTREDVYHQKPAPCTHGVEYEMSKLFFVVFMRDALLLWDQENRPRKQLEPTSDIKSDSSPILATTKYAARHSIHNCRPSITTNS
jgi:hypothetical protein